MCTKGSWRLYKTQLLVNNISRIWQEFSLKDNASLKQSQNQGNIFTCRRRTSRAHLGSVHAAPTSNRAQMFLGLWRIIKTHHSPPYEGENSDKKVLYIYLFSADGAHLNIFISHAHSLQNYATVLETIFLPPPVHHPFQKQFFPQSSKAFTKYSVT